jgi:hypothetical protein
MFVNKSTIVLHIDTAHINKSMQHLIDIILFYLLMLPLYGYYDAFICMYGLSVWVVT